MKINTFRDAELAAGIVYVRPAAMSKLDAWYDSCRDVPFDALTVDDLCIACRQDVYVGELLPRIARELAYDLLAGHMDEGELLRATAKVLPPFERPFSAELQLLAQTLREFVNHADLDQSWRNQEVHAAARTLLQKLGE